MIDITLIDEPWQDVEDGTEALVEEWLVKEGDAVIEGQILASVVLVKANFEVLAPAAGVIDKILVPAESTFARGAPIAQLRSPA